MVFVTAASGLISARLASCPIYFRLQIFDLFAQEVDGWDEDRYEAVVVKGLVLVIVVELVGDDVVAGQLLNGVLYFASKQAHASLARILPSGRRSPRSGRARSGIACPGWA